MYSGNTFRKRMPWIQIQDLYPFHDDLPGSPFVTDDPDQSFLHADPSIAAGQALIPRIRDGDEAALGQLIDVYYDQIVALAYRYVRVEDIARDLAQDAFIGVWNRRATLDTEGNLAYYLRRSVKNAALNVLKREKTRARFEPFVAQEYHLAHLGTMTPALTLVEQQDLQDRVRDVFASLSPRLREVAMLYFDRDLAPPDIAEVLGTALPTVYVQIRKVFQALATAFAQESRDQV